MDFVFAGIFNRAVTVELENDHVFETPKDYEVYLNGEHVLTGRRNVFSVGSLKPDTEYEISVVYDGEKTVNKVTTKPENYLLSVRETGAAGDGTHIDTAAIQAAISICPAGGTVYFPAGTYLTGPLFLKSGITLWLEKDAVILGNTDRKDYPVLPGVIRAYDDYSKEFCAASWEGNPLSCFASLITGMSVSDVDIIGEGVIDGNAAASDWWVDVRKKRGAWRPRCIFLNNCKNIRIQGVKVMNSPSWTVHPFYSDNISLLDMDIYNPDNSPNTDGIDPDSCSNINVIGVRISVGDDCIAIKSGKLYMGLNHYKKTEHIIVRNSLLERGHGSVTAGSETACGISDVRVSKCLFKGTDRGIRVKTRRGRGERSVIEGFSVENVRMDDVDMPMTVNMFYFCDPDGHTSYVQERKPQPVDDKTPRVSTLSVKNVECNGVSAVFLCVCALNEMPMNHISLENISIGYREKEKRRPQVPVMMDNFDPMDGRFIHIENLKNLDIKNVTVTGCSDSAPELINVENSSIEGLRFL